MRDEKYVVWKNGRIKESCVIGLFSKRSEKYEDGHWIYPLSCKLITSAGEFEIDEEDYNRLSGEKVDEVAVLAEDFNPSDGQVKTAKRIIAAKIRQDLQFKMSIYEGVRSVLCRDYGLAAIPTLEQVDIIDDVVWTLLKE